MIVAKLIDTNDGFHTCVYEKMITIIGFCILACRRDVRIRTVDANHCSQQVNGSSRERNDHNCSNEKKKKENNYWTLDTSQQPC